MRGLKFKRQPRITGLAGVGHPHQDVDIKVNGKVVGMIAAPNWNREGWEIRLTVKDGANWKWIRVKRICKTEDEAREFIKTKLEGIITKEGIVLHEEEPEK